MTTGKSTLEGKPQIRIDEGEGAPAATPRRGVSLGGIGGLPFLGLLLLASSPVLAAVSQYVRILPRTYTYNASNVIQFRHQPARGTFLIFR